MFRILFIIDKHKVSGSDLTRGGPICDTFTEATPKDFLGCRLVPTPIPA